MFIRRTIPMLVLVLAGTPALAAKGDKNGGQLQGQVGEQRVGTITVRGQGTVKVRPDGYVVIRFRKQAGTPVEAQRLNTAAVDAFYNQILAALPQLKESQVKREAPSVGPAWVQRGRNWVIEGFEAAQAVRVKLPTQARGNALLGQVFAFATEQVGGDYVYQGTEISERKRQGAERRAAVKAVSQAKKQAFAEAGALGAKVLGVADIGLEEDNGGGGGYRALAFGAREEVAAADAQEAPQGPQIDIEPRSISASRVVKFFLGN